ncbi:hypothetical protein ASPZODRAFT_72010 [Penicilliopsis zonata CBS 506.65]|uniref:Protein EFR3 n=1 Tax=Penicilliopsis zonata CBS 506.65 TaxID=1073090 RepID=A0A1L9SB43_9EURO|nr:hypothetical protein ASPZODRAFT_72010 [Penicilliopsis zonata CBS 506.65]OJJ44371.1 hypothetical protein ASPZODRAFT_72010 [Penicilliopsis zonata CBS 506.65]
MESVRQSCRPKHQVLILKCYPKYQKGVQEVIPNSSELSYLLYYASTRRSKLTKVGAFLEKRAARDVWRRRLGNVQVTLQILTALIEKVPRDLPIYARSILTIIDTVLRSNDISMVEASVATFEMFCRHQDMAALSADKDLAHQYREVVRMYTAFAATSPNADAKGTLSAPMAIRWKNVGLHAIKGVVSSEGVAVDGGYLLGIVLPVVLQNLYNGEDDVLVNLRSHLHDSEKNERELARRRRVSVATVQTADTAEGDPALASQTAADADRQAEMEMRLLAFRCLERVIVSGSSRGQIRIATRTVLKFITSQHPLPENQYDHVLGVAASSTWASSLVELIASWCPVQIRFVILVTAMEVLLETDITANNLSQAFTLVYLFDWLLKSSVNMIGLSVMDVLLGLMQNILRVLQLPAKENLNGDTEEKQQYKGPAAQRKLLALLEQSIGDLATHIYYGDQVADTIKTILARIKASASTDSAANSTNNLENSFAATSQPSEESSTDAFSYSTAKITALKSIKNVLVVANLRHPMAAAGVETRNRVGIHVWEGTHWLLRDPDQTVRYAYADAFLSWLKLETSKSDLQAKVEPGKLSKSLSKRDLSESADKSAKQAAMGTTSSQRERVAVLAQSNFLRLLHLTIYDIALENPTDESSVLLLHLLLANLVEHLGVNAIRFGLPVVLRLQEDLNTVYKLRSFAAKVNIGSLIYGYLSAVVEKFNLEASNSGKEILHESDTRRKQGLWLKKVRLPPASLDSILSGAPTDASSLNPAASTFPPFRSVEDLVRQIEQSYNATTTTSSHNPLNLSGRGLHNLPTMNNILPTAEVPKSASLPLSFTNQMLSNWSKESCLAAIEKESIKTLSIAGSRSGAFGGRPYIQINGNRDGSPTAGTASPSAHGSYAYATSVKQSRRMSVPESSGSLDHISGRGSPVRMNDLRRVLSVNTEGKTTRKQSPLRGRLDRSNTSVISNSSESMVSGAFSMSEAEDVSGSRPQSVYDRSGNSDYDGSETPKASVTGFSGNGMLFDQSSLDPDEIPPVPPIPPSLSIPGGFPNDSQRSLSSANRPSTAPGKGRPATTTSSGSRPPGSLNRDRTRSSTGLAGSAIGSEGLVDDRQRDDVLKLLDGFLSPSSQRGNSHSLHETRSLNSQSSRRAVSGGIGRPPY